MADEDVPDSAPDAFSLIGNETRAAILETLAAPTGEGPWEVLGFSALRERAAPGMDTSQFNYHLQQLVGRFVDHREDGYRATAAGVTLYREIASGRYTRTADFDAHGAGFDCHFCGAAVEVAHEDEALTIRCPDCEHEYVRWTFPPSVFDDEALLDRVDTVVRAESAVATDGVCPRCHHPMDRSLVPAEETYAHDGSDLAVQVEAACPHCGAKRFTSVGTLLLFDAGVISFAFERGLDVTATPLWELPFVATDESLSVRSRDPWEVAVALSLAGETLEVVVDESAQVVDRTVKSE